MKRDNEKEYRIEREYLGKLSTAELLENIIRQHMERIEEESRD